MLVRATPHVARWYDRALTEPRQLRRSEQILANRGRSAFGQPGSELPLHEPQLDPLVTLLLGE